MGKEEKEKVEDAIAESLPTCNDDATSNELTSAAPAEETVIKTEPTVPSLADNDVPMEDVELKDEDAVAVKLEQKEDTDANDNNLDSMESVNEDNKESLAVPVVPAKVNISMKLTSSVPVERRESILSQPSDSEEASEFDADAVIVPVKTQEQLDAAKPRLRGKKFTVMPPMAKDSDLSGLCSIM